MRWLLLAATACGPAVTVHPERAAPTCGGDVVLASQGDVAELAGCAKVRSLTITGDVQLGALGRLASITGDLVVRGSALRELELPRLVNVGGEIVVADNAALTRFSLPALARVRRIEVRGNLRLADLAYGNPKLDELVVVDNPALPMHSPP